MAALHLGALHPLEQALTLLLAFGPFVVLGLVIWFRRREEADEGSADQDSGVQGSPGDSPAPLSLMTLRRRRAGPAGSPGRGSPRRSSRVR